MNILKGIRIMNILKGLYNLIQLCIASIQKTYYNGNVACDVSNEISPFLCK